MLNFFGIGLDEINKDGTFETVRHMKTVKLAKQLTANFNLLMIIKKKETHCYWCGHQLKRCLKCDGKGKINNEICEDCLGVGASCAIHQLDWQ